uniref:AAA family ATPase n=1 Tax=Paenibacillus sp. IHBB 10380 TaxID=1566358 RepID=UPI002D21D8F7|nr:MoxR family ATPase [Paenibacillus sp. IHBB 10380]
MDILRRTTTQGDTVRSIQPVVTLEQIVDMQESYRAVHIHEDLLRYIVNISESTRQHNDLVLGVSPRGSQALVRAVQARAAIHGRDYVLPDDIKVLAPFVLSHRLVFRNRLQQQGGRAERLLMEIIEALPVPSEDQLESSVK